jgi:hypothetical protein
MSSPFAALVGFDSGFGVLAVVVGAAVGVDESSPPPSAMPRTIRSRRTPPMLPATIHAVLCPVLPAGVLPVGAGVGGGVGSSAAKAWLAETLALARSRSGG